MNRREFLAGAGGVALLPLVPPTTPSGELIFPPMKLHNHGSSLVECPNGDLLVCWYRGSGERKADDVAIMASRKKRGSATWSEPFVLADTPDFPDCNPVLFITPDQRLWHFYVTIIDNNWESALLKCKVSSDYQKSGVPKWEREEVILCKPGPEFQRVVKREAERLRNEFKGQGAAGNDARVELVLDSWVKWSEEKMSVRLGWMTRVHPLVSKSGRLLVGLYSDRFSFSLIAYSDDKGATWKVSEPLVGPGNVQPSLVQRKNGTLVAYHRDNGPPPKRVLVSESTDDGVTWSTVHDSELPDPGSSVEAIVLRSGRWIMILQHTEQGRHQIGIVSSRDEGRTWSAPKFLEKDDPKDGPGSYSYPSLLQARDGAIHATYSYTVSRANRARFGEGETIKHVRFDESWLDA